MTSNITNKDALRHELIRDYFENVLLGSCPAFKTKVNERLIESIIVEKAKGAAFGRFNTPKYLEGCYSTPIINLRNNIWKYYKAVEAHKDQENFDKWFVATANEFIEDCNAKGGTVSFGNAQKIINLTLKHLYAYADKSKISHFKYCHFTLDDITYGGFNKKRLNHETSFYKREVNIGGKTKRWTHLTYEDYKKIQDEIRKFFAAGTYKDSRGNILTPFEAEFVIWDEYKI